MVRYGSSRCRRSQLDPYEEIIKVRLEAYPDLSAVRLFDEIRAAGYEGGCDQVRRPVREVRPQQPPEPVQRFETPPAHQGQVDFAEFRTPWGKRHALVVILGYSRLHWVRYYERQTMAVVIEGLESAFRYFGGVPSELLFDQMNVIVEDNREVGGRLMESSGTASTSIRNRKRRQQHNRLRLQRSAKAQQLDRLWKFRQSAEPCPPLV
ncbi:MAG: DDE-type integrase/transposase/recombinase [Gemmatimonadetes bacterium]|nr:DDE-type integrase/transposase/recombinase [Gemmatimonadota bacterium]